MGKARSFRLTKENEARLEALVKLMKLDNANLTFNRIIEDYYTFKQNERLIWLLVELKKEMGVSS